MKFIIEGGKQLSGTVEISGSKNAALPIIAACLLTNQECVLENVPDIHDVEIMLLLLEDLGVMVVRDYSKVNNDNKFLFIKRIFLLLGEARIVVALAIFF